MRAQIATLLILLYSMNMVSSECSDLFDLECLLYDTLFGDDSEENSSEEQQIVTNLSHAVSNLSTTLQNTLFENEKVPKTLKSVPLLKDSEATLDQVPNIVNYLINLTKVVKNVHVESSKRTLTSKHNGILSKHDDVLSKSEDSENSSGENDSKLENEVSQLNKLLKSLSGRIQDVEIDKSKSSPEDRQVIHKKHSSDPSNNGKTNATPSHADKHDESSNEETNKKVKKIKENEEESVNDQTKEKKVNTGSEEQTPLVDPPAE